MRIVSVLHEGPDYRAEHAQYLHAQLRDFDSVCLSTVETIEGVNTLPLPNNGIPSWWSKMELFNPHGPLGSEDLFYVDLDTRIVDDIHPLLDIVRGTRKLVMLSDFYHPQYAASGVMFIPARCKARVWNTWLKNDAWFMVRRHKVGRVGDQGVISECIPDAERWDALAPGAIISYKKHVVGPTDGHWVAGRSVGNGEIPEGARIVCYHGKPRPWECK